MLVTLLGLQPLLFNFINCQPNFDAVKLSVGHIKGKFLTSYGGEESYIFAGIPISKPPIGNLRFKELVPVDNWKGIIETRSYRNACISDPSYLDEGPATISEDCIYANVFTSLPCMKYGNCPVMVVIHGGSGIKEGPVVYNMSSIVNNFSNSNRNIVVVTLPYRTGVMGWFNIAPGVKTSTASNLALRDIMFGLEWVQREIHNFGGAYNKVTVMGHSYGAILAWNVALSPKSEGLFKQLIHMSGTGTGGDRTERVNSLYCQRVAKLLNCAAQDEAFSDVAQVEKIIACIRERTGKEVLNAQLVMSNYPEEILGAWIDHDVIPDYLENLMKTPKKLNVLIGTVVAEMRDSKVLEGRTKEIQQNCDHIAYGKRYNDPERFSKSCTERYNKGTNMDFFSDDQMFYYHVSHIADAFSQTGKVYVYSYAYNGTHKAYNRAKDPYIGPVHSEDWSLVFGLHRKWENFDEELIQVEKAYTGMIANFVSIGSPEYRGQSWQPYTPKNRNYFLIDFNKNLTMPGARTDYYQEAYDFWKNAGEWSPTTNLPLGADMFVFHALSLAQESMISGKSIIAEKNMQAMRDRYRIWSDHLEVLKMSRRNGVYLLSPGVEEPGNQNLEAYNIYSILLIFVIFILMAVVTKKLCCRRGDKYETVE